MREEAGNISPPRTVRKEQRAFQIKLLNRLGLVPPPPQGVFGKWTVDAGGSRKGGGDGR